MPNVSKAKLAAESVFELLDREVKIDVTSSEGIVVQKSAIEGYAAAEKVQFSYPRRSDITVLRGLNLSVSPGQTIALVGQSGCGKSTMIGLLERFYDVDEGAVLFDNRNVKEWNVKFLRSQMALVGQEPGIYSWKIVY